MADVILMSAGSHATRVLGNLWMGGAPPSHFDLSPHFDALVLCAEEYQVPGSFPSVAVHQAPMNDDGSPMKAEEAVIAVVAAGKVVRWLRDGKRVLVTCMAGRNRSGIVCAVALCKGAGMSPDEAVDAIRAARGVGAFRNPDFDTFLRAFVTKTVWRSSRAAP